MPFNPRCLTTAIGSFPHQDPVRACEVILEHCPQMPLWPQLPNLDFREEMEIQYSEGLPCVVFDTEKKRMFFNTSGDITSSLEAFYENYMAENWDYFQISSDFSRGIYEMEKQLVQEGVPKPRYFKHHVTGPVTTGLGRVDENKRAVYYNDILQDVIVKGMEMKARWLLRRFGFLECDQICFIDEPILSGFGSSTYVSVQRSDVVGHLHDVIEAIHKENGLAGIHCCGNTEWTVLIDAGVDIISFDAFEFGETIGYYPEAVAAFLERGGALAWGIVPTSEKVSLETPESLAKKLENMIDNLGQKGIDKSLLWERCLLTPSCGTGSLPVALAEEIFDKLSRVSRLLQG